MQRKHNIFTQFILLGIVVISPLVSVHATEPVRLGYSNKLDGNTYSWKFEVLI